MLRFFRPTDIFLKLNVGDHLFLYEFNKATEIDKLKRVKTADTAAIVRIAHLDESVRTVCHRAELMEHWHIQWQNYGLVLSQQQGLPKYSFNRHPNVINVFDLVSGAQFFYLSHTARQADSLVAEMQLLKIAIKYGSVHAQQRDNELSREKIKKSVNFAEKNLLYRQWVNKNLRMACVYGSYALMMAAEACGEHAVWLFTCGQDKKAITWYHYALEIIDSAQVNYEASFYSIENASLKQGLQKSNSLHINTPAELKELYEQKYREYTAPVPEPVAL